QINEFHFYHGMALVVFHLFSFQQILIQHLLELYERGSFVAANIPEVVGTTTTNRNCLCVLEFLNIYFVISRIAVIFHAKSDSIQQLVVFNQFNKTNCMDLFSTSDYFIGS